MASSSAAAQPRVSRQQVPGARGDVIVVMPAQDDLHTATVVGPIHGLGDSAEGWADPALWLASQLPHVKFVLPSAPEAPVTLNRGFRMPSWYDIVGAGDRFEEGCEGIMESKATVDALVEAEIQAGLDPSRIAIAGFSQGGGMTLFSGLQQKRKLAGLVVMSGYLAGASTIKPTEEGLKTPILHCHGDSDSMVLPEWAEETKRRVLEHGHSGGYTLKTYSGLEHSASMEELQDVAAWLKERLGEEEKAVKAEL